MIKLNNKNITYVALADSNNSVKGVKEIWYADTNNSVKLVYRRKDALIEGEDYEKYHWLEGRNGAYINTEHIVKTYEDVFEVYAKYDGTIRNPDGGEQNLFGIRGGNVAITSYIDNNNNINAIIKQNESYSNYNINIHKEVFKITLYAPNSSEYVKSLDDVSYTKPIDGTVNNDTNLKMYVFARNGKANSYFHGDISYFRITDHTFTTDKLHFIPCKLLKPVPKWLDANGIRRQVGECGMIDLVSGKFYGNVNSVGTFTVENYYERKEWLQGRNGAYIDTGHKLQTLDDTFIVRGRYDGVLRNPSGYEQAICGVAENVSYTENGIWDYIYISQSNHIKPVLFYTNGSAFYDNEPLKQQTNEFLVILKPDGENYYAENNGVGKTFSTHGVQDKQLGDVYLFTRNSMNIPSQASERYFHGDIAYFKITDTSSNIKMNLIPCTLTMDLPASMDANNIARTKGTSGMWDLVSDRFYGNVANSGTFKAVNLAEGVDYEVHQWLKTTLNSSRTYMTLPVNSDNLSFKRIISSVTNSSWMSTNGFRYFSYAATGDNPLAISCWDSNQLKSILWLYKKFDEEIEVVSTSNSLTFGGTSVGQYGYPIVNVLFVNSINGTSEFKTSSIYVDGIERYIPVKLLKSIPSKYDANGIARQAGECGMYDTVNDKFYGNVASSGTFSVSDDS